MWGGVKAICVWPTNPQLYVVVELVGLQCYFGNAGVCICTRVCQNHIHTEVVYGIFGRETTKYTVIRFWKNNFTHNVICNMYLRGRMQVWIVPAGLI